MLPGTWGDGCCDVGVKSCCFFVMVVSLVEIFAARYGSRFVVLIFMGVVSGSKVN